MLQVQSVSDLGQADAASGARVHEPGAGAVAAFLREHHPYELPQLVMLPARASAAYAAWVRAEARGA